MQWSKLTDSHNLLKINIYQNEELFLNPISIVYTSSNIKIEETKLSQKLLNLIQKSKKKIRPI